MLNYSSNSNNNSNSNCNNSIVSSNINNINNNVSYSTSGISARLVAVCSNIHELEEIKLEKRQIPLIVDDTCPAFIMQFGDVMSCLACEQQQQHQFRNNIKLESANKLKKEYDLFLTKYNQFMLNNTTNTINDNNSIRINSNSNNGNMIEQSNSNISKCECRANGTNCNSNGISNNNKLLNETKINQLTQIEAQPNDLLNTLGQLVPCIGCRTSVERFYKQLVKQQQHLKRINNKIASANILNSNLCMLNGGTSSQSNGYSMTSSSSSSSSSLYSSFNLALDPILINSHGNLTLKKLFFVNPISIYKLFYINGPKLDSFIDSLFKSKKNRRCHLHSLESQKQRSINDWLPVWDALVDDDCRKRSLEIETSQLLATLDNYLKKHKFCGDCKLKVIRAFNILTGDLDSSKEKGYCAALYEGIECCCSSSISLVSSSSSSSSQDSLIKSKHLHLINDKQFIANLIFKAESEIQGSSRRERHAKTLEIAQEEVLTCIGIHLYERFHRIYQSMRAEEQTWLLLFYTSVFTLKKTLELEFEKRQGISNLELICAEFVALDESRQSRKQLKKERRKQRKLINRQSENGSSSAEQSMLNCNQNNYDELNSKKLNAKNSSIEADLKSAKEKNQTLLKQNDQEKSQHKQSHLNQKSNRNNLKKIPSKFSFNQLDSCCGTNSSRSTSTSSLNLVDDNLTNNMGLDQRGEQDDKEEQDEQEIYDANVERDDLSQSNLDQEEDDEDDNCREDADDDQDEDEEHDDIKSLCLSNDHCYCENNCKNCSSSPILENKSEIFNKSIDQTKNEYEEEQNEDFTKGKTSIPQNDDRNDLNNNNNCCFECKTSSILVENKTQLDNTYNLNNNNSDLTNGTTTIINNNRNSIIDSNNNQNNKDSSNHNDNVSTSTCCDPRYCCCNDSNRNIPVSNNAEHINDNFCAKIESDLDESPMTSSNQISSSKSLNLNDLNEFSLFKSFSSTCSSASSTSSTSSSIALTSTNLNLSPFLILNDEYSTSFSNTTNLDKFDSITDEEKKEYYANKSLYLTERRNRREQLIQRYQNLKLNANFKIRPRNVS